MTEIRNKYLELIENNFEQLEKDLKRLRASERVKAIIELSKFILPTLKATEMSLSNETKFQAIEIELKRVIFFHASFESIVLNTEKT